MCYFLGVQINSYHFVSLAFPRIDKLIISFIGEKEKVEGEGVTQSTRFLLGNQRASQEAFLYAGFRVR